MFCLLKDILIAQHSFIHIHSALTDISSRLYLETNEKSMFSLFFPYQKWILTSQKYLQQLWPVCTTWHTRMHARMRARTHTHAPIFEICHFSDKMQIAHISFCEVLPFRDTSHNFEISNTWLGRFYCTIIYQIRAAILKLSDCMTVLTLYMLLCQIVLCPWYDSKNFQLWSYISKIIIMWDITFWRCGY
jgi:hypothetical protein